MLKLVAKSDLKSDVFGRAGSSPATPTNNGDYSVMVRTRLCESLREGPNPSNHPSVKLGRWVGW